MGHFCRFRNIAATACPELAKALVPLLLLKDDITAAAWLALIDAADTRSNEALLAALPEFVDFSSFQFEQTRPHPLDRKLGRRFPEFPPPPRRGRTECGSNGARRRAFCGPSLQSSRAERANVFSARRTGLWPKMQKQHLQVWVFEVWMAQRP